MKTFKGLICIGAIILALSLVAFMFLGVRRAAAEVSRAASPQVDLPDLVIEAFSLSPANPHTNEPATVTIRACNYGLVDAPGRRVYLYLDPAQRPPASGAPPTTSWAVASAWPPFTCMVLQYAEFTFPTPGCDHVAYAWVDPLERITESDETNNLKKVDVCVENEINTGSDPFEDDNTCDLSLTPAITTSGIAQVHNFYPPGDEDWLRFQTTAGVSYTIIAAGTGAEAWPTFEVGENCSPPAAFGTTSKLTYQATNTGWSYIKLQNETDSSSARDSSYQISVRQEPTGEPPNVLEISPDHGIIDRNTNMVITGTQFIFPPVAEVCKYQSNRCTNDCAQLLDVSWVNTQRLYGLVPANLKTGPYCLEVTNPGGKSHALTNSFTLYPAAPDPREVVPNQGFNDIPTDLHVYGFNFSPGISVSIGGVPLENVRVIMSTHLIGMLPAGVPSGTHDLAAGYSAGNFTYLTNAFRSIAPLYQDFYGEEKELWLDSTAPQAGTEVGIGLYVHRKGGVDALQNLPVEFSANGAVLGEVNVPSISPNDAASTFRLYWTPASAGDYTLVAHIDPDDTYQESSETNNYVTRTITVLPPAQDVLAPHVDNLTINAGAVSVSDPNVTLSTTVTDLPDPPVGAGVDQIRYIEFEYNQGAGLWIPIKDSGWLNYLTAKANYPWTLSPVSGIHYIQAWAKDGAGNISIYPFQARVNYIPPSDRVGRDQTRIYRQNLTAGQTLHVSLTPASGDADLYIWAPDWQQGRPPWVSNLPNNQAESLSFVAPVSGEYQVEVYGYSAAQFQVSIQVVQVSLPSLAALFEAVKLPLVEGKTIPFAPALPPVSKPYIVLPPKQIFLPMVSR